MSTQVIGKPFPSTSQWHADEVELIRNVCQQIDQAFPNSNNLLVNLTWFGPQFANSEYEKIATLTADRVFFMAAVDAPMMTVEQLEKVSQQLGAKESYYLGNFNSKYQFTFIATLLPKYFKQYTNTELALISVEHLYVSYNRKPRPHRISLVNQLLNQGLGDKGIITLGHDEEKIYNNDTFPFITLNEHPDDFAKEGNWGHGLKFGIPHDIHSLGNMHIWQHHFLNIVGETEFNPWDPMFITEKTWKPILGLRPFVINGQTTIYSWLRQHGFRTFNHFWNNIELEDIPEYQVSNSIVQVVNLLAQMSSEQLLSLYQQMLPDLEHNRQRFYEFAQEQQNKINTLL